MATKPYLLANILCLILLLTGCGSDHEDFADSDPKADRLVELSPEERRQLAPNALFEAVLGDNGLAVEAEGRSQPALMRVENRDGNIPLGVALEFRLLRAAQRLVKLLPDDQLAHKNAKGNSLVYLAAQAGFPDIITAIADRHYSSLGLLQDFGFSHLDPPNNQGQPALFVAADGNTAEALKTQYDRANIHMPFWWHSLHQDDLEQIYLHTAAWDGRTDLIVWSVRRLCTESSWKTSEDWWKKYPAGVWEFAFHGFQTHVGDLGLPSDLLMNRQRSDGKTPLHLAVENRQYAAMRALASCRWLDYDLEDKEGNLPLQAFLKSLNPFLTDTGSEARDAFRFLLAQNTQLRKIYRSLPDRINHTNADGDSTLHLAARLADESYWNQMKDIGDVYQPNQKNQSPLDIFRNRQEGVSRRAK